MTSPRSFFIVLLAGVLSGCSLHGSSDVTLQPQYARPFVSQKGHGDQFVQFTPHTVAPSYTAIIPGSDGNMWFIDENAGSLVRMSLSGSIKEFRLTALTGNAVSMSEGADGKFYISDESANIIRVTMGGVSTAIPIPSGDSTSIDGNALGPDGNVWFAEFNHIGKITPTGAITEFAYPTQPNTNQYGGVTVGADGNVWFAESSNNAIGRIIPSTGKITEFTLPAECIPAPVVLAKDNNVWFACLTSSPEMGSISKSGVIKMYAIGGSFNSNETEQFCERGPDGEPWCASGNDNNMFRVNTATHTVTVFNPPIGAGARPDAVAAGPDGNVWMDTTGTGGEIDVLVIDPMRVSPLHLTFTATGQSNTVTVSEKGTTTWTATSSNTAVATVAQGGTNTMFKVTSTGVGTCRIKISDSVGNSVSVKVTVT